jgi:hypothetical protein
VNHELHQTNAGRLVPKAQGVPFRQGIYWDTPTWYWDDGSTWDESSTNAVIQHERDSSMNPTSGVSTTPLMWVAKCYATARGKFQSGYVYKIDTELLEKYGVSKYTVADHATWPKIPSTQEVILVARNFGVLPSEIIVEVIEVVVSSGHYRRCAAAQL